MFTARLYVIIPLSCELCLLFLDWIKRRKFGLKNNLCGLMYKDNIHNSLRHRLQECTNIYLILDYFLMHKNYGELASPSRGVTVLRGILPNFSKNKVMLLRTLCTRLGTHFLLEGEISIGLQYLA